MHRRIFVWGLLWAWLGLAHAGEGEVVTLNTAYGTHLDGYIAGPPDAPRGVVLFHDKYGFDGRVQEWADRFAEIGYRALVVDLFDGRHANNVERANQIMKAQDAAEVEANVRAAVDYLKAPGRYIATLGWDYGAEEALLAAIQDPTGVAATVMYYGNPILDEARLRPLDQGILLVLAGRDERLTAADADAFRRALASSNVRLTVISVDAGRGFAGKRNNTYDPEAEAMAWQAVQGFLERQMLERAGPAHTRPQHPPPAVMPPEIFGTPADVEVPEAEPPLSPATPSP